MQNKGDIKARRIRGFFLEAAKQIITTQGVESVSARKIAELAGYSYATIYNYYADLDELLSAAKASMVADVMRYMREAMSSAPASLDDVKALFAAYVRYQLEHPHVFRFFYFHRLVHDAIDETYDFSGPWALTLRFLVDAGKIGKDDVAGLAKTLIYAVHGLLALHFSGNGPAQDALFGELDQSIDVILRR